MVRFDVAAERKLLRQNLEHLKSLSVEEYTFRKKWDEMQNGIPAHRYRVHSAYHAMWGADSSFSDEERTIESILTLRPKVVIADTETKKTFWDIYRLHVTNLESHPTPGRFIKFLVVDANSKETQSRPGVVLGIGALSGDFPTLACRDEFIGWTKKQREDGMLNHSAVASTLVPTQPFGFNFLGGKLVAALATSAVLRNEWELQYGDVLAGMTTTSLYGSFGQYNGLKWWKSIGSTKGSVPIQPDDAIYERWHAYVKKARAAEYRKLMTQKDGVSGPVTGAKMKVLSLIYDEAEIAIKEFQHGHERGVYYSAFYENSKEFLSRKITREQLVLKPLFQEDIDGILAWWRPKAIERFKKLKAENRIKRDPLFYNELHLHDYESAKKAFFAEVGR